jgi:hypothetical protein
VQNALQFYLWYGLVSDDDGQGLFKEALHLSHPLEGGHFRDSISTSSVRSGKRAFLGVSTR